MALPFGHKPKPPPEGVQNADAVSEEQERFDMVEDENDRISGETDSVRTAGFFEVHGKNLEFRKPTLTFISGLDDVRKKDWENKFQLLDMQLKTSKLTKEEIILVYSPLLSLVGYLLEQDMPFIECASSVFSELTGDLMLHCSEGGFQQNKWGTSTKERKVQATQENKFT